MRKKIVSIFLNGEKKLFPFFARGALKKVAVSLEWNEAVFFYQVVWREMYFEII